jgi:adenine-specific DNA-methyltransferase
MLNQSVDVIYLDPPYPSTMNKYIDFYGPFDRMFDENIEVKTELTNQNTFLENFSNIIRLCVGKTKYIAISLNNKSYPSAELLIKHISCFVENYSISTKGHIYRITGKENKNSNEEILLVCKMKESL